MTGAGHASASLSEFGIDINDEPRDGMQCTGVTRDGSRCPNVVAYTADRLLCPACHRRETEQAGDAS